MMTLQPHVIAEEHFQALAAGYGDERALAELGAGQLSRRKLLLRALAEELSRLPGQDGIRDRFEKAWELLAEIENRAPDAVTGPDGVLRHPYLGVWAMQCLRDLIDRPASTGTPARFAERLGYFSAVVAVAAGRAGLEAELEVVVPGQGLTLPMLGRVGPAWDGGSGGAAVLRVSPGEITVRGPGAQITEVTDRTRTLRDAGRPIRLEDLDPFRDAFGYQVSDRLTGEQSARWSRTFDAGWRLIGDHHEPYLPGLAAGLGSITPLAGQASGADASAACRHAFGAIGTALPPTPARLAVLLIHEFQHVKLGALLDLVTLLDDCDPRLYHAPWRPDPRPLPALLQGAYAHLAVTDFWRRRRHYVESVDEARAATGLFVRWREQTATVIDVMLDSPALTDLGRRFISGMAAGIAPWLDEAV